MWSLLSSTDTVVQRITLDAGDITVLWLKSINFSNAQTNYFIQCVIWPHGEAKVRNSHLREGLRQSLFKCSSKGIHSVALGCTYKKWRNFVENENESLRKKVKLCQQHLANCFVKWAGLSALECLPDAGPTMPYSTEQGVEWGGFRRCSAIWQSIQDHLGVASTCSNTQLESVVLTTTSSMVLPCYITAAQGEELARKQDY